MAQQGAQSVMCRSCLRVARQLHVRAASSKRALSSTPARQRTGALPVFQPTQSEPLAEVLDAVRSKIFVPAYLSKPQQNLIYKTKNHALLRNDPFVIEIGTTSGTEQVVLEPINKMKDVPNSWASVLQAVRLMSSEHPQTDMEKTRQAASDADANAETHEDPELRPADPWANFVPLLDGMHTAGRRWKPWQWETLARLAGEAGATHALLAAAQQMEQTGLYIYDVRVAREIFWACRARAELGGWTASAAGKALSFAEQFTRLLADPRQADAAKRAVRKGEIEEGVYASEQPEIIGVVLELAARKAEGLVAEGASETDVQEAKAMVATHVARLAPNLDKIHNQSAAAAHQKQSLPPAAAADYVLLQIVPVLRALQAAERVLGSGMPFRETASRSTSHLERTIAEAHRTVADNVGGDEGGKRRGFRWAGEGSPA